MAATADEEAIIKHRYLTQTVTTTANVLPPLKGLARRFFQFRSSLVSGSHTEAQGVYEELLVDLHAIQSALDRMNVGARVAEREAAMYSAEQQKLEASIAQTRVAIEAQKEELAQARRELQNAQEYEVLKRQVVAVPPRSVTRREMDGACREIADLQAQARGIDGVMARRRAALTGLLSVMDDVAAEVEAEAPAEEGVLLDGGVDDGELPNNGDAMDVIAQR